MVRVAYTGANLVTIAVPLFCLKYVIETENCYLQVLIEFHLKIKSLENLDLSILGYFVSQ